MLSGASRFTCMYRSIERESKLVIQQRQTCLMKTTEKNETDYKNAAATVSRIMAHFHNIRDMAVRLRMVQSLY